MKQRQSQSDRAAPHRQRPQLGALAPLQRQALESARGQALTHLRATAEDGAMGRLPAQLRSGLEALSGMSMDHVAVHRNSAAPARFGAQAFAQGDTIHLGPGQERHLPHEAWHVVQQAQGRVVPTRTLEGVALNDSPSLEREADVMGQKALNAKG